LTIKPIVILYPKHRYSFVYTASFYLQEKPKRVLLEEWCGVNDSKLLATYHTHKYSLRNPIPENVFRRDVTVATILPIRPGRKNADNLNTYRLSNRPLVK